MSVKCDSITDSIEDGSLKRANVLSKVISSHHGLPPLMCQSVKLTEYSTQKVYLLNVVCPFTLLWLITS